MFNILPVTIAKKQTPKIKRTELMGISIELVPVISPYPTVVTVGITK